jgi:hypothetical protein
MGRYSRKDMLEFAKFAKSYQSPKKVDDAYQAYLKGARLVKPDFSNSPVRLLQQSNVAYLDGKIVKNLYGDTEASFPINGIRIGTESWDENERILKLKTILL